MEILKLGRMGRTFLKPWAAFTDAVDCVMGVGGGGFLSARDILLHMQQETYAL